MERSLDDTRQEDDFDDERDGLKVTFPLLECIQRVKEKHHTVSKLHRERYEQVKKLVEALESYASHLEPTFVAIKLPPTAPNAKVPPNFDLSPTYVAKLDSEFTRVYEEYNKRIANVCQIADEIINLWSELGTPQAQVDSQIVQVAREAPEQLGLHQEDMKRLAGKRDKLLSEKSQREKRLKELRSTVESLWDRLAIEDAERKQFLASNRGCGLRVINEFEDELSRLNELKRQNLHLFVEDARFKLQELWDSLYFSEEEMLDFAPAFSDVYSDALLSAHEQEIVRLEALKGQRAPVLAAIEKHRSLIREREELEKSSHDASRLMAKGPKTGEKRDPGKLLREEKMRKRIAKDLPKVDAELRKTLEAWEDDYGRPFCVHGERYLDELEATQARAPPPRSKTPNALAPARDAPKSGTKPQSQSRNGTLRGAAPPRSKTPTATVGRSEMTAAKTITVPLGASVASYSQRTSPSKIPGATRLPMSTMRDGNNSPQRRLQTTQSQSRLGHSQTATAKGPPPKMKDLFIPPTPTPSGDKEDLGDIERSASIIRHMEPEDPYNDTAKHRSYEQAAMQSSLMGPPTHRGIYARSQTSYSTTASSNPGRHEYPMAPPSRQLSNTSSVESGPGSVICGSENWESYTDTSDTEDANAPDATYYSTVQAQRMQQAGYKRPAPGMHNGAAKRVREQHIHVEQAMDAQRSGPWIDDGDLGDTF